MCNGSVQFCKLDGICQNIFIDQLVEFLDVKLNKWAMQSTNFTKFSAAINLKSATVAGTICQKIITGHNEKVIKTMWPNTKMELYIIIMPSIYEFQIESTIYTRSRHHIWSLSNTSRIWIHNCLVHKQTLKPFS